MFGVGVAGQDSFLLFSKQIIVCDVVCCVLCEAYIQQGIQYCFGAPKQRFRPRASTLNSSLAIKANLHNLMPCFLLVL